MPIYTKWPRLLVVGESVTEAQANEILIRTNGWRLMFSNDKVWLRTVVETAAEFGYPPEPERGNNHDAYCAKLPEHWRLMEAWHERIGVVELEYLHNDRVMSAFIGGPHGWCDWTGRIGSTSYNIGKWPNDDDVTSEWQRIAEAFPYLDLTAQCIDEEGADGIAAQWRVVDGTVTYEPAPTDLLTMPTEFTDSQILTRILVPGDEQGVPVDRLRQAIAQVAA